MPSSTPTGAYLICATPRTGSTLLCGLLRSTGVAGQPESYFREQGQQLWLDRWQIARGPDGSFDHGHYVQAAIRAGSSPNGVFGARVMWGTLGPLVDRLADETSGRTSFIYLSRGDIVAQAVSWVRAEQTTYWQRGDTAAGQPQFDFDQIHSCIQTIKEHNAAWQRWFTSNDIEPYVVGYENLVADMPGVTLGVLGFLGLELPRDRTIGAAEHRQADEINEKWIARYRSMARAIKLGWRGD